jgi:hypothetical protein
MDDNEIDLSIFLDEPRVCPQVEPPSQESSMRLADGSVVRFAVYGGQARLTIAGPDGMATCVIEDVDARLFADLASNAFLKAAKNVRGF